MNSSSAWSDPKIALDGWAGAAGGAIISIAIALVVLIVTVNQERKHFQVQLERDRDRAIEDRRLEAFGGLCGALSDFGTMDQNMTATRTRFREVAKAFHLWALYVPLEHDDVVRAVARALGTIRQEAAQSWKLGRGTAKYAQVQFDTGDGYGAITWITSQGRRWHLDEVQRVRLATKFMNRFPDVGDDNFEMSDAGWPTEQ
ncbi:hypothetical protein ACFS27_23270 [Promicromonospora vindobonensis]|uniref:DUF4760 domain-containing protein n=1 Tax=Promicromonospora vindobonensis TaxID=195748 RepID=A0ABW5VYB6_9MICO